MSAICLKALCLYSCEFKGDYWQGSEWCLDRGAEPAVTLIACVCDRICQSHSAVCLSGVWQVFDAAQALERIKPFLNWLYLSPCATGAQRTSNASPPFLPLWTNELFLSKNMCRLWDHRRRLNNSTLWELGEQSRKTKKWLPALILSSLAIAQGLHHDPDGPCLCFCA